MSSAQDGDVTTGLLIGKSPVGTAGRVRTFHESNTQSSETSAMRDTSDPITTIQTVELQVLSHARI